MYEAWFANHTYNSEHMDLELVRKTFFKGGYYRVDLSDEVSVLAMNTIAFSKKNDRANQA